VLRRAVELGVNFIDTADSYGPAVSGKLIAEALHPYPDDLVIATKGGPGAARAGTVAGQRPAGPARACRARRRPGCSWPGPPSEAGGHLLVAAGMVGAVVAPGSSSADVLLMYP
jgi:hypothetical protein